MSDNLGRSGYIYSTVTVVSNFTYTGDGINGVGVGTGQTFIFAVRERDKELVRPRQDTTDGPYGTGVSGPISHRIKLVGYFKGQNLPHSSFQNAYLYIDAKVCLDFIGVILVESFHEVGVIDGALHFEISGTSDGTYLNTDIVGA